MYLYLCWCQRAIAEVAASWKASTQAMSRGHQQVWKNHLHSLDKGHSEKMNSKGVSRGAIASTV